MFSRLPRCSGHRLLRSCSALQPPVRRRVPCHQGRGDSLDRSADPVRRRVPCHQGRGDSLNRSAQPCNLLGPFQISHPQHRAVKQCSPLPSIDERSGSVGTEALRSSVRQPTQSLDLYGSPIYDTGANDYRCCGSALTIQGHREANLLHISTIGRSRNPEGRVQ